MKDLINELSVKELKTKSENWLYEFYLYIVEYCNQNPYSYSWLLSKPIIKTRTDNFSYAKDQNGLANLFRKSNGVSDPHTVHTLFTTQSENVPEHTKHRMLELLNLFGIQERSPQTTIEIDYLRKWPHSDLNTRIKLFHEIARVYNKASNNEKIEIIKTLNKFKGNLILAKKGNELWWVSQPIYENTDELSEIFNNVPDVYFIDPRFWTVKYEEKTTKNGETKRICLGTNELCRALGVTNKFIVKDFYAFDYNRKDNRFELSNALLKRLRLDDDNWKFWTSRTHYIDNFKTILSNIDSIAKGKTLLNLLAKINNEQIKGTLSQAVWRGHCSRGDEPIASDPFIKLNEIKWCYNEDGEKVYVHELTKDQFINTYQLTGREAYINFLYFKDDARKHLNQEDQDNLAFLDSCSEEELRRIEELKKQIILDREQSNTGEGEETIPLNEIPVPIIIEETIEDDGDGPIDTIPGGKSPTTTPLQIVKTGNTTPRKDTTISKVIGDFNERIALRSIAIQNGVEEIQGNSFKTEDGRIITLLGGNHKGYDIKIEKNDEIIMRIEVKPYEKQRISISPTEWEYAKKYKEQYSIYRVRKIDGQPSEIYVTNNPYQLFKKGKIELIPSALKLLP